MDQPEPRTIQDRYHLTDLLGKGGMAAVYLAHDQTLERQVAIKLLTTPQTDREQANQRFMREARAVARLSHPNIMTLYDMGREGEWHYLVLEYIPGTDLHSVLEEQGGPLALVEALRIAAGVLRALAYAHGQGLVHRDVKPENIMLTPDGLIKVTDFGLALIGGDARLTAEDAVVGTVLYMAPEVLTGTDATPQSDLYGVGAVLYEIVTGQPPYGGDSMAEIVHNVLNAPLTPPTLLNPALPPEIEEVVEKLLSRNPADRYATAEEVLAALPSPEEVERLLYDVAQRATSARRSQSLLERIVRGSSGTHARQPAPDDEEDLLAASDEMAQELLIYAAQEDLMDALEAERQTMARALSDTVIGQLNLMLAQINAYEQTLGPNPQARMVLNVLSSLTRQALQDARDLEDRLHPASLQTLGLEPALEALAAQLRRARGLDVILALQRLRERLPAPVEMALFRAAQAAIDRASREAHASRVEVRLERHEAKIAFTVSDNGVPPAGDVLRATRQRVQALGGRVDLRTGTWGGLEMQVSFPVEPPVTLTDRELDVIRLVAEGLTNKEIAALLFVSPRTVKFHLDNVFSKLGVSTRTEAAIIALRRGWVRQNPPPQTD